MRTIRQFARFALVGISANLILYVTYLLLTRIGMGHKVAMSLLYLTGVCSTFVFNKSWSFQHDGKMSVAFFRYLLVYLCGYIFNLAMLLLLVDRLGWPHEYVQGVVILSLAILLFLSQKFWVFRYRPSK
jgi:putative flippase GtrA